MKQYSFPSVAIKVNFKARSKSQHIIKAANWLQKEYNKRIGTFRGPDPTLLHSRAKKVDIKSMKDQYNAQLKEVPEWKQTVQVIKECYTLYNNGVWIPLTINIIKVESQEPDKNKDLLLE